jgi:hypothetical protein
MTTTYICPPPHTPPPPIRSLPSPTTADSPSPVDAASLPDTPQRPPTPNLCTPDHSSPAPAPSSVSSPPSPLEPFSPPQMAVEANFAPPLRLRAPSSLRRPLLICRRPGELRPRIVPQHLSRRPRLHPHRPLPLVRRHRLPGRRPTCSQRTQTALFAASVATATTIFGSTTTVLCATEARSYLCKRAEWM